MFDAFNTSVGLDPGQTRLSMGQVGEGQNINELTDPSVEHSWSSRILLPCSEFKMKVIPAGVTLVQT
jgi:hypothetical protein